MIIRKSVVAAGAIVVALGMSGCSSDETTDTADTAATAATLESVSGTGTNDSEVATPTAQELHATLDTLVDPQAPIDEKVTLVENGDERRPNIEAMTAATQNYRVGFEVTNVTVDGATATADVTVISPHGEAPATPWTWDNVDGAWKVSDVSTCGLLAMASAPCN